MWMWGKGGGVEDVPLDWYFSEEDIKVYGGTKIHPKDQLITLGATHEVTTNLRHFQEARIRYVPTEIETLRGKGNKSSICLRINTFPNLGVGSVFNEPFAEEVFALPLNNGIHKWRVDEWNERVGLVEHNIPVPIPRSHLLNRIIVKKVIAWCGLTLMTGKSF